MLSSMNIEAARIDSAIRISLSKNTNDNEMDLLFEALLKQQTASGDKR